MKTIVQKLATTAVAWAVFATDMRHLGGRR
jgi:hypothetical protein